MHHLSRVHIVNILITQIAYNVITAFAFGVITASCLHYSSMVATMCEYAIVVLHTPSKQWHTQSKQCIRDPNLEYAIESGIRYRYKSENWNTRTNRIVWIPIELQSGWIPLTALDPDD